MRIFSNMAMIANNDMSPKVNKMIFHSKFNYKRGQITLFNSKNRSNQ